MLSVRLFAKILFVLFLVFSAGNRFALAQNTSQLSGIVVDQNGDVIPGVQVTILSASGTLERTVLTDEEGFFTFPLLLSDDYTLKLLKEGFDPSETPDFFISAENPRQFRIELKINPISETIQVEAETAVVDETDESLNTFEKLKTEKFPLNGRNHQSLINLVPGVVFTPVDSRNLGQFSANGQRTNANFFTVDGISANFGTTNYDFLGQTGSGSIPAMNVQGGLDNLVSTEALQEVKVQTLDFAPSTGKMPGANVSFISRSGGDNFSLTLFENFRNAAFNAKDYFDIEKPPHNLHNFGGSFGGPVPFLDFGKSEKPNDRTFFFLAFEGKRFTLPRPTVITEVPSIEARKYTPNPVAKAIYNAFPLPNAKEGKPKTNDIIAQNAEVKTVDSITSFFPQPEFFRATYSDPNNSESYNLRVDHKLNSKLTFFGRFNYSPSFSENRNPANLSSFFTAEQITRTLTLGSNQAFSSNFVSEFRFNLSKQNGNTIHDFDGSYGGILPDTSIFIPSVFDAEKTHFRFSLNGFTDSLDFLYGNFAQNEMRQISFADNFSYSRGDHEFKFGVDYRELSPALRVSGFGIDYDFNSVEAVALGTANRVAFYKNPNVLTKVLSISSFAQDNWKINSRFSLIYGLRWEINPAPSTKEKDSLLTLKNAPNLAQADQTQLTLADSGTPYYQTSYKNIAPRIGAAFKVLEKAGTEIILRGGFGTFYDLGQSQFNEIASPFKHTNGFAENLVLPISSSVFDLSANSKDANNRLAVVSAAPDYETPRTYFWNLNAQLKIKNKHLFSASYVGGAGRNLQRTLTLNLARPQETTDGYFSNKFSKIIYIDNAYSSDYNAFQFQYSHSLSNGFETFANYAWSHSIDNNSSDSNISTPFLSHPVSNDRGNSDFDARHVFNLGFSFNLPNIKAKNLFGKILSNWTFGGIFFARTGLPYDVKIAEFNNLTNEYDYRRADVDNNLALFTETPESPTGKRLNDAAFTKPAERFEQGNLGRNAFSGAFVWQFDSSVSKKINLTEKIKLQFTVEAYNIFNRPNFGNPQNEIFYTSQGKIVPKDFGVSTQTMARSYASAEPTGGVSPIFQLGGARTLQFNLRINF